MGTNVTVPAIQNNVYIWQILIYIPIAVMADLPHEPIFSFANKPTATFKQVVKHLHCN